MTYKEYEEYLKASYSPKAIAEMWTDAMPENPIISLGNNMFILKDDDGINELFTSIDELLSCIDTLYIQPFEQKNGWMY